MTEVQPLCLFEPSPIYTFFFAIGLEQDPEDLDLTLLRFTPDFTCPLYRVQFRSYLRAPEDSSWENYTVSFVCPNGRTLLQFSFTLDLKRGEHERDALKNDIKARAQFLCRALRQADRRVRDTWLAEAKDKGLTELGSFIQQMDKFSPTSRAEVIRYAEEYVRYMEQQLQNIEIAHEKGISHD